MVPSLNHVLLNLKRITVVYTVRSRETLPIWLAHLFKGSLNTDSPSATKYIVETPSEEEGNHEFNNAETASRGGETSLDVDGKKTFTGELHKTVLETVTTTDRPAAGVENAAIDISHFERHEAEPVFYYNP